MWVRFPANVQARSYLVEWLEDTAAPFPGMSLAVENGHLRIFLGTWVDLAPVQPNRWSRLLATKEPGAWLVELDGVVIGQGSTANLGAQVTELVLGAGTFAGAGVYAEHAAIAVSELRVWDLALSDVNRPVLAALDLFIAGRCGFLDMASIVEDVLAKMSRDSHMKAEITLENVQAADAEARRLARER